MKNNYFKNYLGSFAKCLKRESQGLPRITFATPFLSSAGNYFKKSTNGKKSMNRESGAGSTIIELLVVVIIIISVFSVTLIANFPKITLQVSLSEAAYTFEQNARKAQLMSLSPPEYKDSHGVLQVAKGYGVYVDTLQNKKYIIYADRAPANGRYDGAILDDVVEVIDFSQAQPGIIIKQINNIVGSNVSVNYSGPSPITTITPEPEKQSVDVVFALEGDLSQTKTVSINTAGLIEVK